MGNFFYYPLEAEATSYHRRQDYNALGIRKANVVKEENEIDKLHRGYCADLFLQRRELNDKRLLLTTDDEEYAEKYPQWEPDTISDLKIAFQLFDLNRDGLIDLREMAIVLDYFGEDSPLEERMLCFQEIDVDHSGMIDFEEFLGIVSWLQKAEITNRTGENIGIIVDITSTQAQRIRQMSVPRQISHGIF